jgi:hypothetical protein
VEGSVGKVGVEREGGVDLRKEGLGVGWAWRGAPAPASLVPRFGRSTNGGIAYKFRLELSNENRFVDDNGQVLCLLNTKTTHRVQSSNA